jgi:feruloyl esterase
MNAPWVVGGDGQATGLRHIPHGVPGFQDSKLGILLSMMEWIVNSTAPTDIIATKYAKNMNPAAGAETEACIRVYPSHAACDGTGDIEAPKSWSSQSLY